MEDLEVVGATVAWGVVSGWNVWKAGVLDGGGGAAYLEIVVGFGS